MKDGDSSVFGCLYSQDFTRHRSTSVLDGPHVVFLELSGSLESKLEAPQHGDVGDLSNEGALGLTGDVDSHLKGLVSLARLVLPKITEVSGETGECVREDALGVGGSDKGGALGEMWLGPPN